MPVAVRWRERALEDVAAIREFVASQSPASAERLLEELERNVRLLAERPGLGRACEFRSTRAHQVRSWTLPPYPSRVVFCLPRSDGIEVVRVLRGARDRTPLANDPE